VLTASGDTRMQRLDAADVLLEPFTPLLDCYTAAARLAAMPPPAHHRTAGRTSPGLRRMQEVPDHHLEALGQQIEAQRNQYEEAWDEIEVAVALVKADGFDVAEVNGKPVYTARISFDKKNVSTCTRRPRHRRRRACPAATVFTMKATTSTPTLKPNFWTGRWACCKAHPTRLKAFGSPAASPMPVRPTSTPSTWATMAAGTRYTPDFVLRRADGKHLVVEIKNDKLSPDINADLARLPLARLPKPWKAVRPWP
jgi:type III restriction enzyme